MRLGIGIVVLCVGLVLGVVFAQEETKTVAPPVVEQPPVIPRVAVDNIWRYHYEGKKGKGEFLEIADPEGEVGKGRTLVITNMDVRMRQTMRASLIQHVRTAKQRWKKEVVRSELFSIGWLDGTTKFMAWNYSGWVGMRFKPGTRPALAFTQGSGDLAVYAEGYWVRNR